MKSCNLNHLGHRGIACCAAFKIPVVMTFDMTWEAHGQAVSTDGRLNLAMSTQCAIVDSEFPSKACLGVLNVAINWLHN